LRYLGGKYRIRKWIVEHIFKFAEGKQRYLEPFVGSASVTVELIKQGFSLPVFASDVNEDLILMFQAAKTDFNFPDFVTEEEYRNVRIEPASSLKGFIGIGCSFGGKWFGGYARHGYDRNPALELKRGLLKDVNYLKEINFSFADYRKLNVNSDMLVYCDPPYSGTTPYKDKFNSEEFFETARKWRKTGANILISEYSAPPDFIQVAEIERKTNIRPKNGNEIRVEKLFTLN
jgi:DNA adenine methylase